MKTIPDTQIKNKHIKTKEKQPKITKKQQEILKLLFRYRFLHRIQIQMLLRHKDYKTINLWLKDLREKQYVEWIYSTDFAEKTKPAIYYLGINGIRFLRQLTTTDKNGKVFPALSVEALRKRYRETTRSRTFVDRCLLLADCCITLRQSRPKQDSKDMWYFFQTEANYLEESSYYHFLADNELIHPDLCYSAEVATGSKGSRTTASYLLHVFDSTLPRYRMKKRLGDYVKYLDEESETWKDETNTYKLPIIQFVCPSTTDLIYAKRRTRKLVADAWEWKDDDEERPRIRFTTMDKLKEHGVLSEGIWEKA